MTDTRSFLGDPDSWDKVKIQLTALQALWGGWIISASGSGEAEIQHISPIDRQQRYRLALAAGEVRSLIEASIENDLLNLPSPSRPGHPDETMVQLTLVNAAGVARSSEKWAGDRLPAFDAVSGPMFALIERIRLLEPDYAGPFEWPSTGKTPPATNQGE